ncbi:MAG: bifunctional UDP-N-acetylglucosamine diphosphorylase/glucosamine-1-phosphate N-acetyltransferase GlmU [Hyphomicrobiales bacterium]|nr:bifunctional UDP-N-acetylglucosamine diphosphorylase/glucosamine-1-phosphate N-acetyltransferase GlmU [Hyphomicrobiales bacterium]
MTKRTCLSLVLAAGEGTRMKSARPKVMQEVAGRAMIGHVLDVARAAGSDRMALVVGPDIGEVAEAARREFGEMSVFTQQDRLGTAHAVLTARAALEDAADDVLVLYGDTPLIRPDTLRRIRETLAHGADLVILGFRAADPTGYGRLIADDRGAVVAIREERDASAEERTIVLCNSGVMGFRGALLPALLEEIGNDNAKKEFYLTDAVALARAKQLSVAFVECAEEEVLGVNSRAELARVEAVCQQRLRHRALEAGVTMTAPETVFLSYDTEFGPDVKIEPNVVFGPGVTARAGATIRAFSHIEAAEIGEGATVGPFARLRPGARIGARARVGNFVEIKASDIGPGAKVNHLTYVGDATVGAHANIGAGTITCNYDGYNKHRTVIGAGAFIGSNTALVAPVTVGKGAYVGSGSVITKDVEDDALALERTEQIVRPGWAARLREKVGGKKSGNKKT